MNQADKDLIAFYNSLPGWAQSEFQHLLRMIDRGAINRHQLDNAVQDLITRAEQARSHDGPAYWH